QYRPSRGEGRVSGAVPTGGDDESVSLWCPRRPGRRMLMLEAAAGGVPRQAVPGAARSLRSARDRSTAAGGRARRGALGGLRVRAGAGCRGARAVAAAPTAADGSGRCASVARGRAASPVGPGARTRGPCLDDGRRLGRVLGGRVRALGRGALVPDAERTGGRGMSTAAIESIAVRRLGRRDLPELLRQIHDPPGALFLRGAGDVEMLADPAVAIVGARACSPYGAQVARMLGRELAAAGLVVVSGLARGIDGEAHRGALDAGGLTVAVLGCGIDRDYPAAHGDLARRISERGLVVSEYEPGIEPAPWRFPARNRIIAGLAVATVIVEARERSGALITA